MQIFVAASYSSKVNHQTGAVFPEYKKWLEAILNMLEAQNHQVFCALRADQYMINSGDPVAAFRLDMKHLEQSDAILALLGNSVSAGVQTEIGVGVALQKKVILAYDPEHPLGYFNAAMAQAGTVQAIELPLTPPKLTRLLSK